jgi:F0F1-type ATP synthase membrane subunit b/b'
MEDNDKNLTRGQERLEGEKAGTGLLIWVMAGVILGLTVANGFLFWRTNQIEAALAGLRNASAAEIASVQEKGSQSNASMRQTIEELNRQLQENATRAEGAVTKARATAQRHAEKLVQTLAEESKARQEQISQQIGEVKEATDAKVTAIVTDVGDVRGQVAETRSTLDSTLSDLKSVRGDLGVQSGLIATNAKELSALKELGERNYYEFSFARNTKQPYKIGGILVSVKRTDAKRFRYTLDVTADDRRVEKKDKYINEPVQFYVAGSRLPYEIVVNEVHKDRIVGYLATPKLVQARR